MYMCFFIECNEPMVQGSSGVLQPKEGYVVATLRPDGYTCFDLPSNRNTFTLVSYTCNYMRITNFKLWVREICSDGQPVAVSVVYNTYGGQVCYKKCKIS